VTLPNLKYGAPTAHPRSDDYNPNEVWEAKHSLYSGVNKFDFNHKSIQILQVNVTVQIAVDCIWNAFYVDNNFYDV
jgi:hypothetical protein